MALIALGQAGSHSIRAAWGVDAQTASRSLGLCIRTVEAGRPFEATADEPGLPFYSGVPILGADGIAGAVGVMDAQARSLDARQLDGLQTVAAQVAAQLELRRQYHVLSGMASERERVNTTLAQTRLFVEMAGRSAQVGGWVVELPSRRVLWSDEVAAIFEQPPGLMYEFHDTVNHYLPESRDKFMEVFDYCIRDGTPFDEEMEIISAKGRRLWVRTMGQAVRDMANGIVGVHGMTQDITRAKATEAERHKSQEQLKLLELSVSRLNDLVLITEAGEGGPLDQRLVFVNDAVAGHTGYSREEVLGRAPRLLQGPRTQRAELDRIRAALLEQKPVRAELINYRKHGEEFWIELDMVPVADEKGNVANWVAVGRDITLRKAVVAEIQRLAFYDPLTQLPNRLVLMDRLEQALASCTAGQTRGALMFIDLDNFKILNDTLGHDKGDMLLEQVARRLMASVRPTDTVARLGGDEFVVMLENLGADAREAGERASIAAEKILLALSAPYTLSGSEHYSTSSIGVTSFSGGEGSVSDLLKQADLAMYQAKTW
ncbi:MAG: diguanylate cyclase, partial [Ramlibacter sp.]